MLADLVAALITCVLAPQLVPAAAVATAAIVAYHRAALYRPRLAPSILDDLPRLLGNAVVAVGLVVVGAVVVGAADSTSHVVVAAMIMAVSAVGMRALTYAVLRWARRSDWTGHRTLVVGAGLIGAQLASSLLAHRDYGLRPVGFLDSDPLVRPENRPVPLLGNIDELGDVIVAHGIATVVIAFGSHPESSMVDIIRTCHLLDVDMFFVPRLFELHQTAAATDQVWGVPLIRLRRAAYGSPMWHVKRLLDVMVAGVGLLLLAPLMVGIAIAV
ncbi:MAG: hypothetical protein ABIM89_16505, partial [Mycobacteriales bacterium]